MAKKLFTALLIVVFFTAFAFSVYQGKAYRYEMRYSEIISQNTSWTKANNPISLSGNVLVVEGVTLTIEAGVTVNFDKNVLQVNGTLRVEGTEQNKVTFTSTNTQINDARAQLANINFGDNSSGNIIRYATFHTMAWTYYNCNNSIVIDHVTIQDGATSIPSGFVSVLPTIRGSGLASVTNSLFSSGFQLAISSIVINNTFSDAGISASDGSFLISNNTIIGTASTTQGYGISINSRQKAVISDNYISNYAEACISVDGPAVILRNYLESIPSRYGYPFYGIRVEGSSPLIENNTITNTGIGIDIYDQEFRLTRPIIRNNNIFRNINFNLYLGYTRQTDNLPNYLASSVIDASGNYWGPNVQAINQTIHDSKYQSNLGTVNTTPVLTALNSNAIPNPNAFTPTIDQVPDAEYYQAAESNTQPIVITKTGNLTVYSNAQINITTNPLSAQTNVTLLIRGDLGYSDFANITIPKNAIPYGTLPTVYFANQPAESQGYTQDTDNYYIWCTSSFSEYFYGLAIIEFAAGVNMALIGIIAIIAVIVIMLTAILIWRRKNKR